MNRRLLILTLSSVALLALGGCVTAPPRTQVTTRITVGPPPPMVETISTAPYPDSYWIPGHWKWAGDGYIWSNGHWEQARPNMVYQRAYWVNKGGYWTYHSGRWVAMESSPAVVVNAPPPAPLVEVVPPPPSPGHAWISGYWRWANGRHNWVPGHWENARPDHFWVAGHWVRRGSNWSFSGGYWQHY